MKKSWRTDCGGGGGGLRTSVKKSVGTSRKMSHAKTQMVRTEPKQQPKWSAHCT